MLVLCYICNKEFEQRLDTKRQHTFQSVCYACRCSDCHIVFDLKCGCDPDENLIHGLRSPEDPAVCVVCIAIRARVANMDPEFLAIRNANIAGEDAIYA